MTDHCEVFPPEYRGKTVEQIDGLRGELKLMSTDFETWTKLFECSRCGQVWAETFEETGHGEVPVVRKLGTLVDKR